MTRRPDRGRDQAPDPEVTSKFEQKAAGLGKRLRMASGTVRRKGTIESQRWLLVRVEDCADLVERAAHQGGPRIARAVARELLVSHWRLSE